MENNGMIKLGGLWKNESLKSGETFYSGKFGYSAQLLVFKNKFKRNERDPDLIVYVAANEKKEKQDADPEIPEDSEIPF